MKQDVDADGKEVPRGEPGELVVRGYNVMQGYFDDDANKETIDSDGWLHTGDIAVMNERGYIRITDRKKDMYIMGGFNCYPQKLKACSWQGALMQPPWWAYRTNAWAKWAWPLCP